jgi:hypothetical protein
VTSKLQKYPTYLGYLILWISLRIDFDKNGLGYILGDFFSQTHLVTLTLDKVIFFTGTIFQRSTKLLFTSHKIGWRAAEKVSPFFSDTLLLA